jgi:hypothetical protein
LLETIHVVQDDRKMGVEIASRVPNLIYKNTKIQKFTGMISPPPVGGGQGKGA